MSREALNLLLDLGAFDEADAMMQGGQRRHPYYEHFARGYVQVAHRRGNLQEALRRCEMVRRKFPCIAEGYTIAAACLTDLGRHDEAAEMMKCGVSKLPDQCEIYVQQGRNATHRREWLEALRAWEVVWGRFRELLGALGAAQCLREIGRFADAERFLTEANLGFARNVWVLTEWANLAVAKGDYDEGVRRWQVVLMQFPYFANAYPRGAEAMRKLGREAEADELLRLAVTRIPSDLTVHLEYARSAHRREDWSSAIERWGLVRNRFPECAEAREKEAEVLDLIHR